MSQRVEEVQAQLEKWLLDEGYNIKKVGDGETFFAYTVAKAQLPILTVLQPKVSKDSVLVVCGISFSNDEMKKISKIPVKEKEEMLWNLRMRLLQSGCRFVFIPNLGSFNVIRVMRTIYYDGLLKNEFFKTLDKVIAAALLVMLTIQRKIGISLQEGKGATYVS